MSQLLASIPAPPGNALELGPLTFRYYGLAIALGVLAAVEMARRRWATQGGDPDDMIEIAKWAVPAGLVGTRIYHLMTDWKSYQGRWLSDSWRIWEGGLGIPGGLVLGIAVGVWVAKRRNMDLLKALDTVIPGIPVAQAIGRLGNWFNQEIFGPPTDLPWALEVDERFRPAEYADSETFHPTFLYEGLWNLGLAGLLVYLRNSGRLKRGQVLPLYVFGYGVGRFIVESVRIDPASLVLGVRINHWISGVAVVIGALWFLYLQRRPDRALTASTDTSEETSPDAESAELLSSEGEEIVGT